ncbi:MAG TPA: hypothetical protein VK864_14900 [Longimicrobiales bacterium]|nr:hypothetical protein [Longimicrobiales bacterium]
MSSTTLMVGQEPRAAQRPILSGDTMLAAGFAVLTALWFSATTAEGLHWFVLPVTLCAALIGGDAVRWLRGRLGAFDPAGVLGLIGLYLFFVAPLLHVRWDFWMRYVQPPPDWRNWLGAMAILNCAGLVAYRAARAWVTQAPVRLRRMRVIDARRFWIVLPLALLIAGVAQYWVYDRFGGLLGYVRAYQDPGESFQGMGIIFLVSESFPILAMIGFAVLTTRYQKLSSWWVLVLVLIAFFALKIIFGGLRGSRSNTVWGLFWAVGIIHLWIRPLPRRALLGGLPLLAAFMFGYGLYKAAGLQGLHALLDPPRALELARRSNRTLHSTLLSDLGRSDVQAYVLYRTQTVATQDLAWGRTYLGGMAILVPRSVLSNRPPTKVKEGTDITYGRGTYDARRISRRVYGLAGEAMLNVGALGVPVVFLLWGVFVGGLRRAYYGLARFDTRTLLLPLWVNLAIVMLIGDSDNVVFFLVKHATLPFLILLLCSRSVRLDRGPSLEQAA